MILSLLGILHGANAETQKLFACQHYSLGMQSCAAPSGKDELMTMQMVLIDHIASADTSMNMKNGAMKALECSVRERLSIPLAWHRFVLEIMLQVWL